MVRKRVYLLIVILILLLSAITFADFDTGYSCADTGGEPPEYDCQELSDFLEDYSGNYYCEEVSGNCFLEEEESLVDEAENTSETEENLTLEQNLLYLQDSLTLLQSDLASANSNIGLLSKDIPGIKQELAMIQSSVNNIKSQISSVENQQNSISVGLAGLQQNLDSTQTTLEAVEDSLEERKGFTRFMTILILVLVVIGVAAAVIFYTTAGKPKISQEIVNYITSRIKSGSKYPQIKNELLRAGWSEEDIDWAYKETAKRNYEKFKGPARAQRGRAQPKGPGFAQDHRKMIVITGVSLLLLVGVLLVLRGVSTGQAISFQKLVGGEKEGTAGKITYEVECTPPHIVTPDGDACCLDANQNGACDNAEARNITQTQGQCIDNAQCNFGEYCINSQCASLSSLYQGKGDCSKLCNYYTTDILTSDEESYKIKPKKGSYTSAGALEWKVLGMPDHCKGEQAIIPVNIIKKKTGSILNEKVILLHQGETSPVQTHPEIPSMAFTLKVDKVYEVCSE